MPDILVYARMSTDDHNVAGQQMLLKKVNAIRVFTDVILGKRMTCLGSTELLARASQQYAGGRQPRPAKPIARQVVTDLG